MNLHNLRERPEGLFVLSAAAFGDYFWGIDPPPSHSLDLSHKGEGGV